MRTKKKAKKIIVWEPDSLVEFKMKSRAALKRDEKMGIFHRAGVTDTMKRYCGKTIKGVVDDDGFINYRDWYFSADMAERSKVLQTAATCTFEVEDESNFFRCKVYGDGAVKVGCTRLSSDVVKKIISKRGKFLREIGA